MNNTKRRGASGATATSNVIDNPCWGDPQHCSLAFLLTLVKRDQLILYESNDYILLNKPADLRMDGAYPSTVHKLLTYWYPPPSLKDTSEAELLEKLKTLHRHCDIPDNELRPCHQLDYATSGVLLVARSSEAASRAASCFEHRRVQKTYLALVHGHVAPAGDLPTVPSERVDAVLQQHELDYRRQQQKQRKDTFMGFQPPHHFLQILQGRFARRQGTATSRNSKKRKRNEKLTAEQWEQVEQALQLSSDDQALFAQLSWKQLRKQPKLKEALERATDCYNDFLRNILAEAANDAARDITLPTVFRVEGDDDNVFYIYLAVAQVDDDFAMRIPSSVEHGWLATGEASSLNFKVALTKCSVVQTAHRHGHPVTKVRLEPRTGRRHQLRVHTAFLGHPIVGDQTYECRVTNTSSTEEGSSSTPPSPPDLSPRMCLHAWTLGLPLLPSSSSTDIPRQGKTPRKANGKDKITEPGSTESIAAADTNSRKTVGQDSDDELLQITAPDPFPISKEGHLTISPMLVE